MLTLGFDAETKNGVGRTALHIAAAKGHSLIASALLKMGANGCKCRRKR